MPRKNVWHVIIGYFIHMDYKELRLKTFYQNYHFEVQFEAILSI